METAGPALRRDPLAAAIITGIRCFLHHRLKCLYATFGAHFTYLHFCKKNKSRYCSAMRSAIPGLSRWVFSFNAASSFLQARLQLTAVIQLAFTLLVKLDKISETPVFSRLSDLAPIIT